MKQIYFDCGVEHLLFVRYNPDSYKTFDFSAGGNEKGKTHIKSKKYKSLQNKLLVKYLKEKMTSANEEAEELNIQCNIKEQQERDNNEDYIVQVIERDEARLRRK